MTGSAFEECTYACRPGEKLIPVKKPRSFLIAADSFLAENGTVPGLSLHRERFVRTCMVRAGLPKETCFGMWDAAMALIPAGCGDRCFPRIELAGRADVPIFQVRIRNAPPLRKTVRLACFADPVWRRHPRFKGPDLEKLGYLRQDAVRKGADDAILVTRKGLVLETITAAILWADKNTLYMPPEHQRRLDSVTAQLIRMASDADGIPFAFRVRHIDALNGKAVYTANALHGVRRAVPWKDAPFIPGDCPELFGFMQQAIERFREKI